MGSSTVYDVIIVGGGPAGLSTALILGRCRRQVLVVDAGHPRNEWTREVHGFLTRDGTPPSEMHRIACDELKQYTTVEVRKGEVTEVTALDSGKHASDAQHVDGTSPQPPHSAQSAPSPDQSVPTSAPTSAASRNASRHSPDAHFEVTLADGTRERSRRLMLATGVVDDWPKIPGAEPMYGTSIHHCPYCDGWEWRDAPVAVYGRGEEGAGFALEMTAWTQDIVLCTDGPGNLSEHERERLRLHHIPVREERVIALEGEHGYLREIRFAGAEPLPRRALFFSAPQHQRSLLPVELGCDFDKDGAVVTDLHEATCVPGLYVAGDASRAAQFAIVAAAEGALAAEAINTSLLKEDLAAAEARARHEQREPRPPNSRQQSPSSGEAQPAGSH